jgi:hypothetical protein
MTAERSQAYARVLTFIDGMPGLQRHECDLLREAADALLFATAPGTETQEAVSEARALAHALVDSGRCRTADAAGFLTALRSCGPEGLPASMASLRDERFARHLFWPRAGR